MLMILNILLLRQTAVAEWKVSDLKSEDEGTYACQAKNAAGYAMERIHLFVIGMNLYASLMKVLSPELP